MDGEDERRVNNRRCSRKEGEKPMRLSSKRERFCWWRAGKGKTRGQHSTS